MSAELSRSLFRSTGPANPLSSAVSTPQTALPGSPMASLTDSLDVASPIAASPASREPRTRRRLRKRRGGGSKAGRSGACSAPALSASREKRIAEPPGGSKAHLGNLIEIPSTFGPQPVSERRNSPAATLSLGRETFGSQFNLGDVASDNGPGVCRSDSAFAKGSGRNINRGFAATVGGGSRSELPGFSNPNPAPGDYKLRGYVGSSPAPKLGVRHKHHKDTFSADEAGPGNAQFSSFQPNAFCFTDCDFGTKPKVPDYSASDMGPAGFELPAAVGKQVSSERRSAGSAVVEGKRKLYTPSSTCLWKSEDPTGPGRCWEGSSLGRQANSSWRSAPRSTFGGGPPRIKALIQQSIHGSRKDRGD